MKKNTKIIVAVVVILLMIIGGCIYGFVLEKNEVGTPSQDNTQTSRSRRPSRKNRMTPSRKRLRYSRRIPIRRAVSPL